VTINSNAAQASWSPRFVLACALGVAFMLTMIACKTAGSSVAAATEQPQPDDARQSKAGGQNKGQAQSPKASPDSPEAVVAELWQKLLITCPVPREPGKTATFYGNPEDRRLFELRDAKTTLAPKRLTEADRLNGIQFAGAAAVLYSTYRYFSTKKGIFYGETPGRWSPFVDAITMNKMGTDGGKVSILQVDVERRNGKWSFKLSGEMPDTGGEYNLDDFSQVAILSQVAIKKSCAALTSANPFAAN
jgi:hypothetical protein